jgi:hypothetical protein
MFFFCDLWFYLNKKIAIRISIWYKKLREKKVNVTDYRSHLVGSLSKKVKLK